MTYDTFKNSYLSFPYANFALDMSKIGLTAEAVSGLQGKINKAFESMAALEKGAIANPDEQRMVGHYWLRDSSKAPSTELKGTIDATLQDIKEFAGQVHAGKVKPEKKPLFKYLLVVGIGGSALGPQFVNQALSSPSDPLKIFFFDNTDADGMARVLQVIPDLAETLCVVISKSGGTKETRNGMLVAKAAWEGAGLNFSNAVVAVTGENSELDKVAVSNKWLGRFPMWDWVGGRTSELSAVGLLPAALQGFNIDAILQGAREMDALTRVPDFAKNPAAQIAAGWYVQGQGKGTKAMVVLPYSDRLELFSKYLQQLVMESLGKEKDLDGNVVNQGICVFGNKGSTDQHAYVQQLREGLNNFYAVFIEVLSEQSPRLPLDKAETQKLQVEPNVTCHDYLGGFYQGTRTALFENGRASISIAIKEVSEYSVGALIALFERVVGFYGTLVNVNAYHQPGVEAGKKAAAKVLDVQHKIFEATKGLETVPTAEVLAQQISEDPETVFLIMRRLAANGRLGKAALLEP